MGRNGQKEVYVGETLLALKALHSHQRIEAVHDSIRAKRCNPTRQAELPLEVGDGRLESILPMVIQSGNTPKRDKTLLVVLAPRKILPNDASR